MDNGNRTVQNLINLRRIANLFLQPSIPSDRMIANFIKATINDEKKIIKSFTVDEYGWLLPTRKNTTVRDLMKLNEQYEMLQKHSKYCSIDEFSELPSLDTNISLRDVIYNTFIPRIKYDEIKI